MIRFDESGWPVVVVHFEGSTTDDEFVAYLERLNELLARKQSYAIVLNATHAHFTPLRHQRMQADWLRHHKGELTQLSAGIAFVFAVRIFRLVVTGVFMLQPPPAPHRVCATLADGVRWAAAQVGVEPNASQLAWDPEETTRPNQRR